MSKTKKVSKETIRQAPNEKPLKIKGSFLDVFKVVKKHKEDKLNKH